MISADLKTIREYWQKVGVSLREGASERSISLFEHQNNLRLSDDLRSFYRLIDGMESGDWDQELIRFWPLSEIGTVPRLLSNSRGIPDYGGIEATLEKAESYYVFADHSILLWVYAVRLSDDVSCPDSVVCIWGKEWEQVAPTFGAFLSKYTRNPLEIFPGAIEDPRTK